MRKKNKFLNDQFAPTFSSPVFIKRNFKRAMIIFHTLHCIDKMVPNGNMYNCTFNFIVNIYFS